MILLVFFFYRQMLVLIETIGQEANSLDFFFWLGIVMLIGLEVQMTEKALQVDVSIWEPILFHGSARSRTVCPYLLQKQSILQQEAAVHN